MRILKINSEIQKAVSNIINQDLKNPLISGIISVTKVDTTQDLEYSKIYLSILSTSGNEEDVFNQIKRSVGFIKKELARKIKLRKIPDIIFYLDDSYQYGKHIEDKLAEIDNEKKGNNNEN